MPLRPGIYSSAIRLSPRDIQCQLKGGIDFASDTGPAEITPDLPDDVEEYENPETLRPVYDVYVARMMDAPEHRRAKIALDRLNRSVAQIAGSWRNTSRDQSLRELDQVLVSLHEIESRAESINDVFLRGHVLDRLDTIAAMRRSLAEEIRWEVQSTDGGRPQ